LSLDREKEGDDVSSPIGKGEQTRNSGSERQSLYVSKKNSEEETKSRGGNKRFRIPTV